MKNHDLSDYLGTLGFHTEPYGRVAPNLMVTSTPTPSTGGWPELEAQVRACTACKLSQTRSRTVFGVGNREARLVFVGEAPGADEDERGEPFVGPAGQLLDKMIEAMGFKRSDVYLTNVVKSRPPENRNPEADEIEACAPFLRREIELIDPEILVALGAFAAQTLLGTESPIGKLRGTFYSYPGLKRRDGSEILVMPTYHPAFLLRNATMKKPVWDDLQLVMKQMEPQ